MIDFIKYMALGWVVYTPTGRNLAKKVGKNAFKMIKKQIENNPDLKELLMIKDALLEDDDEESIETDCEQTKDNRSKD